jgi:diacylglycerol kinase family enzyme
MSTDVNLPPPTEPRAEVSTRRSTTKRPRRIKPDAEIVLVCNPRAGGQWKELASILDSEESRYARRIVTDSVEDIAMALDDLGHNAKLLCVYGGDGTVQRVLDRLAPDKEDDIHLALIGGGTMNVTSRWCGFSNNPGRNFRYVVRAFRSGELLLRELPLLAITTGDEFHHGFTFGMGPIVRLLDAYERGPKGKVAAAATAARAVAAAWLKYPSHYERLLTQMDAEVELDGDRLPHTQFSALFANVTGQINPGVEPFVGGRSRQSFHCAAYAVGAREMTLTLPLLIRGWLPKDLDFSGWLERSGKMPKLASDQRYVNRPASRFSIKSDERLYTIDGELLTTDSGQIAVELGPMMKLAAGPGTAWKMAAESVMGR